MNKCFNWAVDFPDSFYSNSIDVLNQFADVMSFYKISWYSLMIFLLVEILVIDGLGPVNIHFLVMILLKYITQSSYVRRLVNWYMSNIGVYLGHQLLFSLFCDCTFPWSEGVPYFPFFIEQRNLTAWAMYLCTFWSLLLRQLCFFILYFFFLYSTHTGGGSWWCCHKSFTSGPGYEP